MNWKLVDKDGVEVSFPYECEDFRGEKTTVIGGRVPHKPGSSGFIYVDEGWYRRELYPSVCNLKWENVDANND